MLPGGSHQKYVLTAIFPVAPPSTDDAIAIFPQDLEVVTHRQRNQCSLSSAQGLQAATLFV